MARVDDKRTGYLELFFDLVFVFAVTQLIGILRDDQSAAAWRDTIMLAWLIWWAWSQFVWAGNAIDLDRRSIRLAMLGITGVTLLAASAIPVATSPDDGMRFAVPYAVVCLAGLALYWIGLRGDQVQRAALRNFAPIAALPPLLVLAAGFLDSELRPWFWAGAVVLDIASPLAGGRGEFRIVPAHFAERHGLIVLIALGESIVVIGATVARSSFDPDVGAVTAAAFTLLAVQWWGYFDWVQQAAEQRLASEHDLRKRGRLARDLFTFGHFPIVLGSALIAFGIEHAVADPASRLPNDALLSIGLGLSMFYVGFILGNLRATGSLLPERLVALIAVVVITVGLGPRVDAITLLWILAPCLVLLAAIETKRRSAVS